MGSSRAPCNSVIRRSCPQCVDYTCAEHTSDQISTAAYSTPFPKVKEFVIISHMEARYIHHRPRHFNYTLCRTWELDGDIMSAPMDLPSITVKCPDCDCSMMYRGIARRRNGTLVHYFECIHSHREVHSVSVVITD
jgi:hypothetical protein